MKRRKTKEDDVKRFDYKITNFVAAGYLGMELDLYELPILLEADIEYEPEQFPGAILKLNNPKATLLIFKNGKVVIVGCRDKGDIKKAVEKVYDMLKPYAVRLDPKVRKGKIPFEITNIVAASDIGGSYDLFEVALELEADIEYEPEQFPGAIIKLDKPRVSVLLFKNGKIIIAGATSRKEIEDVVKRVYKMTLPFRR